MKIPNSSPQGLVIMLVTLQMLQSCLLLLTPPSLGASAPLPPSPSAVILPASAPLPADPASAGNLNFSIELSVPEIPNESTTSIPLIGFNICDASELLPSLPWNGLSSS